MSKLSFIWRVAVLVASMIFLVGCLSESSDSAEEAPREGSPGSTAEAPPNEDDEGSVEESLGEKEPAAPELTLQDEYQWRTLPFGGGGLVSAIVTGPPGSGLVYARTDVGGAYRWDRQGQSWIPLTDWVSPSQTSYLGIESLAVDPNHPNRLYMLAGTSYWNNGATAILRSDDYGQNFSVVDVTHQFKADGNGMGRQSGEKLVVDPNNSEILYTGTRRDGLFRSTDRGASWQRIAALNIDSTANDNGISFVVPDANSAVDGGMTQTLYVGVSRFGDNLYVTHDAGASWSPVTGHPNHLIPQRGVMAADGMLYVTYADGAGPHGHSSLPQPFETGEVWRLAPSEGSWADIKPIGLDGPFSGISVDPKDPSRLVLSTINTWMDQGDGSHGDRILISNDRGENWQDLIDGGIQKDTSGIEWAGGTAIHWVGSVAFDPADTESVFASSGNGVWLNNSVSSDNVWRFAAHGIEETVPTDLVSIPGGPLVSLVLDYDGAVYSDVTGYPAGTHKPGMGSITSPSGLAYAAGQPNIMVRVGRELFYSTDTGQSWTLMAKPDSDLENGKVAISADGTTVLWAPGGTETLYRTTDWGISSSWSQVPGIAADFPVGDPANPEIFYAYSGGSMYVSLDKGKTFSERGHVGLGGNKRVAVVPGHQGHLWVALRGGGLVYSLDGGESFQQAPHVTSAAAVGIGKAGASASYPTVFIHGEIQGEQGIFGSTDQGTSWVRVSNDQQRFGSLANGDFVIGDNNHFGRVYRSTAGRGIVVGELINQN